MRSGDAVGFELRPWGVDDKLVELLGELGAAEFRALFDAFPDPVGILWALRGEDGSIVDFAFGYGNLAMLSGFRLTAATPDRYTLLEALPVMRGSHAFDEHVRVCETGVPSNGSIGAMWTACSRSVCGWWATAFALRS